MPRRRVVVTEVAVSGNPNPAWDTDQCDVESPPDSPTRRSSSASKGSSLRRSLSRTFSSFFRSSSSSSPSSPTAKQPPTPQSTPAAVRLTNGNRPPLPEQIARRPSPPTPQPQSQESPATLPRLYQKRPQVQVTPAPNLRRKPGRREEYDKSASLTRISDLPDGELGRGQAKSSSDIVEAGSEYTPQRRWHSTLNTMDRNSKKHDSATGKLRFSSTFVRKSVGDDLNQPATPTEDAVFDEVDSQFEHRIHSLARHKPKGRIVKREPSRVERKEAYGNSDLHNRTSSMSGSTNTLTRLSRKAPVAVMTDL